MSPKTVLNQKNIALSKNKTTIPPNQQNKKIPQTPPEMHHVKCKQNKCAAKANNKSKFNENQIFKNAFVRKCVRKLSFSTFITYVRFIFHFNANLENIYLTNTLSISMHPILLLNFNFQQNKNLLNCPKKFSASDYSCVNFDMIFFSIFKSILKDTIN